MGAPEMVPVAIQLSGLSPKTNQRAHQIRCALLLASSGQGGLIGGFLKAIPGKAGSGDILAPSVFPGDRGVERPQVLWSPSCFRWSRI